MNVPPIVHAVWPVIDAEYKKPAPKWRRVAFQAADRAWITEECAKPSDFDPQNTRQQMLTHHGHIEGRQCAFGTVYVFSSDPSATIDMSVFPWDLWGRILRLYSDLPSSSTSRSTLYRVFVFAVDRPREFPATVSEPITPLHINGGYTYPCNRQTIVIYRAEDATRVLLHELQHAACLDDHRRGIDAVEAETEAWAELLHSLLVPFAFGDLPPVLDRLQVQAEWIVAQNRRVRRHLAKGGDPFCRRYTTLKEDVWRRWGLLSSSRPAPKGSRPVDASPSVSLRLTAPVDPANPFL